MTMMLSAVYFDDNHGEPIWRDIRYAISGPTEKKWAMSVNDRTAEHLRLNLSNVNIVSLFDALGLKIESHGAVVPVDDFLRTASNWLQKNLGKPSVAREPRIDQGEGRTMIVIGGARQGYFNRRIHQAVLLAQEGKELGANHIMAQ